MVKYRISSNRRMPGRLFPSRYSRSSATGPCYAMHVKITSILRCLLSNHQGLHNLENTSNNLFCTIATCKVLLVSNISRCSTPLNSAIIFATHLRRLNGASVYSREASIRGNTVLGPDHHSVVLHMFKNMLIISCSSK